MSADKSVEQRKKKRNKKTTQGPCQKRRNFSSTSRRSSLKDKKDLSTKEINLKEDEEGNESAAGDCHSQQSFLSSANCLSLSLVGSVVCLVASLTFSETFYPSFPFRPVDFPHFVGSTDDIWPHKRTPTPNANHSRHSTS